MKGYFTVNTLTAFVSSTHSHSQSQLQFRPQLPSLLPPSPSLEHQRFQTSLLYRSVGDFNNSDNSGSSNNNMSPPDKDNDLQDNRGSSSAPAVPAASSVAENTTTTLTTSSDSNSTAEARETLQSLLPPLQDGCRRIYLIRHGETDWNTLGKIQGGGYDIPLNDNGRLQAGKAAAELDGIPLNVIASSSLSRAKETADILHARHTDDDSHHDANGGVRIVRVVDAGFNEMSFGEWEGFASRDDGVDESEIERFKDTSRRVKVDPTYPFPGGGESTRQVEQRSVKALYDILNSTTTKEQRHIAIVSHGRTNKILIAAVGLGDVQRFKEVRQANVAINVMDVDEKTGMWTVHVMNFHDHVQGHVIVR